MHSRVLALSIALAGCLSGVAAFSGTAPAIAAGLLCSPAVRTVDAGTRCFPPSAAWRAERMMPVAVVTPRGTTWRISGLRLTQVSVERGFGGVAAITYLFGRLPVDPRSPPSVKIPLYNAPRPLYVLVREFIGHTLDKTPLVFQTWTASGHGAWHFVANFDDRNLALHVTTNESRTVARRVGLSLKR